MVSAANNTAPLFTPPLPHQHHGLFNHYPASLPLVMPWHTCAISCVMISLSANTQKFRQSVNVERDVREGVNYRDAPASRKKPGSLTFALTKCFCIMLISSPS